MSQQINLYSPIFRRQKKYFSATTMAFSLGVVMLGIGALTVFARIQVTVLDRQAVDTSRRMAGEAARLQAMISDKSGETRRKELETRIAEAEATLQARQQFNEALKSDPLGTSKGFSTLMRAFARQTVEGVWLTQIGLEPENTLTIAGRALRAELVPVYFERLRQEPVLRGYAFEKMEITTVAPTTKADTPGSASIPPPSAGAVAFRLNPTGAADPGDKQ